MTGPTRRDEIAAGLDTVRTRITAAALAVDRDPDSVTLVVVTKTFPATDIELLAELGVRDVGENRHPEAGEKAAALVDLDLVWHFVGQVQSNKATRIAGYADVVHSVDSVRLVQRLNRGAADAGRTLTCLVQVSLDPPAWETGRGGLATDQVLAVASAIEGADALTLAGLMAVAPLGGRPDRAFGRLRQIADRLRAEHPSATAVSAGMSDDFEEAIRSGATHVRVGSAVLGHRASLG